MPIISTEIPIISTNSLNLLCESYLMQLDELKLFLDILTNLT